MTEEEINRNFKIINIFQSILLKINHHDFNSLLFGIYANYAIPQVEIYFAKDITEFIDLSFLELEIEKILKQYSLEDFIEFKNEYSKHVLKLKDCLTNDDIENLITMSEMCNI